MFQEPQDGTAKAKLRAQINENLKRVYEDSLKEEIPDRFRLLLDQLRAKEGEK